MKVRQDAMTAVAEAVVWIERRCGGGAYPDVHNPPTAGINAEAEAVEDSADDSLVCTTGSLSLWPGASNVIAGAANFSVDIRCACSFTRVSSVLICPLQASQRCMQRACHPSP